MILVRFAELHPLYAGVLSVAALQAALLLAIVIAKLLEVRNARRMAATREAVTGDLLDILECEDGFSVERNCVQCGSRTLSIPAARGPNGDATRETIISILGTISGEGRERLIAIVEQAGYLDAALAALRSRSSARRIRACMMLGGMLSERAVDPLLETLGEDRNPAVRIAAAEALADIGLVQAVPLLLHDLRFQTRWQRLRLANVLALMGDAVVPDLVRSLQIGGESELVFALDVISDIGTLYDIAPLVRLVKHPSPEVRGRAIELLSVAGAVDAIDLVIVASRDPVWFVRLRAIKALERLGVPDREDFIEPYYARLTALLNDAHWWVRQRAAAALARADMRGKLVLEHSPSDAARAALQLEDLRQGARA